MAEHQRRGVVGAVAGGPAGALGQPGPDPALHLHYHPRGVADGLAGASRHPGPCLTLPGTWARIGHGGGRLRAGCVGFVLILASASADRAMGIPLFPQSMQVRGYGEPRDGGGQGQRGTADLPLFSWR